MPFQITYPTPLSPLHTHTRRRLQLRRPPEGDAYVVYDEDRLYTALWLYGEGHLRCLRRRGTNGRIYDEGELSELQFTDTLKDVRVKSTHTYRTMYFQLFNITPDLCSVVY